jgi:hypothetical protein
MLSEGEEWRGYARMPVGLQKWLRLNAPSRSRKRYDENKN